MQQSFARTSFFVTLLLAALLLVGFLFLPYLATLSIAAAATVIAHPFMERVTRAVRGRRWIAAFIVVLITMALIIMPLTFIGIQVATQAGTVYTQMNEGSASFPGDFLDSIEGYVQAYVPGYTINLQAYAGQGAQFIASHLGGIFTGTISVVMQVFLGLIAYYYMLKDGRRFVAACVDLSPLADKEDHAIFSRLRQAVDSVIKGSLIIATLQGIATGVGLALFGIPNALLLGFTAAVCALIPNVGAPIVLAPTIIYLFVNGDTFSAVGLIAWGVLGVGLIDNFLHPLLIGRTMRLHPFFILFSVIGGLTLFGVSGFILGPLALSLLFALLDIYHSTYLGHRHPMLDADA